MNWKDSPSSRDEVLKLWRDRAEIFCASHVLDLGCGEGDNCIKLAAWTGCGGQGVDLSLSLVTAARAKALASPRSLQVEFSVADARALPFKENSFTHAVADDSFTEFCDPEAAYLECYRVLRPQGKLCVTFPSASQKTWTKFFERRFYLDHEVEGLDACYQIWRRASRD